MINKNLILGLSRATKRLIVIFIDFFACFFSVWFSIGIQLDEWNIFSSAFYLAFLFVIFYAFPLFIFFGLYRSIFRYIGSVVLDSLVQLFIVYSFLIFITFSVVGVGAVPKALGIIQPIILFICIGGTRYLILSWLNGFKNNLKSLGQFKPVALIYGAGSAGRQLLAAFSVNNEVIIKGFIDDDYCLHGNSICGVFVYSSENLQHILYKLGISDVLIALPSVSQSRRNQIMRSLEGLGIRVRTLPSLNDLVYRRVSLSDLHDPDVNELLGRDVVPPQVDLLEKNIRGKDILVTGAGGSIGSELCREIIKLSPKSLVLVENSEFALYKIHNELNLLIADYPIESAMLDQEKCNFSLTPYLASVQDRETMLNIFNSHRPSIVFHAAAYKHVPMVERNPVEGLKNNVFGTLTCAQVSIESGVKDFVLISTDKAVRPTNIMGASKRIAELIVQALEENKINKDIATKFSIVRFGNVLGSSGSVAPLFMSQIKAGGPITLTDLEVTRYFMTIREASQLVIQASALAIGGDVFVLDMGSPVRIHDLAVKMIYLSGHTIKNELNPSGDIAIEITGLRPGEKLFEELLIGNNPIITEHPKIMRANEELIPFGELQLELENLQKTFGTRDIQLIKSGIKKLVHDYPIDYSK